LHSGHEQSNQDGNDGYHDQQFNERESTCDSTQRVRHGRTSQVKENAMRLNGKKKAEVILTHLAVHACQGLIYWHPAFCALAENLARQIAPE
jgi:hypothetical protein